MKNKGYTLIELIVVIVIVGILYSVVSSAMQPKPTDTPAVKQAY